MENIFEDSNTVITPELNEFYSNSFLVKGNPANENVIPAPQVGGANDDKAGIKSLINQLNNVSDISANKISNIQSNYTDPLADAKMFTFNPTYKGLNWDRYKNHSDFDKLGFDPFRDNEKFYNDNSSIYSDITRGVKGFGKLALGMAWESVKDLPKLLSGDWAPNTEGAKYSERILSETMSTRGTFGSSVINFGINAGFTVGIIGELIAEEMLLAAVGLAGAPETGGASLGAAAYLTAVKGGLATSKIASIPRTTGALLKALKNLDNVADSKRYFTQFGRGAAQFLNPLQSTTDLIRNFDNLKGLGQVAIASRSFGAFFKDVRNINRSFSEAKLEGGFVQNTMFEKLLGEAHADGKTPTPEEIDNIKEASLHAGYMNELINFPVILYTNNITFGALTRPLNKLLGTTGDSIRMLNKTITADITRKKVFQELAGGWKATFKRSTNPRLMASNTLNYFSANIAEGLQESFQEASSIAIEDYYTKLYNNEHSIVQAHQELSILDSYGKGIGAQFSRQGAETFLSGFLMGGLMHKSVKGVRGVITGINESSNKIKDLFYSNTNPESFKTAKEAREAKKAQKEAKIKQYNDFTSQIVENQNAFFEDAGNMFSRDLAHMSAQEIIDAKAKHAQETGDDKFLIDQTDASLFESITNAQYFGKFDLYLEHLNKILELDDQGLMEAINVDDAQAGRQRLMVSIDRAKNIQQRLAKAPKNEFNYNDYKEGTPEYNEMVFMHNAFEDARNAAVFTPYHFDRVLERIHSVSKAFTSIDLVANGNATEFLHLFGEKNIADEVFILFQEKESLKDGTPENEKLAKEKDKQIAALSAVQSAIIEHKGYFQALKENEEVNPRYEKNLKKAFVQYLSTYADIKKSILKSDKLDTAFKLFHDFHRLNIDSELLSKSVAVVSDPDFLRQESLRRYNAIKKLYENRKELIKKKWDVYFKKIGLNGVFQKLYEAGFAGDPEQMVEYNLSGGKTPATKFYRTKDFSLVTFADTEDIAKINEIFNEFEDITGITKEREEAAKKAEEAAAKKAEEEAEAARVAEKAKALDNFTPETKAKLVADYEDYELKDEESFEEYLSSPRAVRIIAAEKQPAPVPAPIITPAPITPTFDIKEKRKKVRAAIQKAGQGEGGQFFVTLSDGTRESAVRISLVGDELGIGNKGNSVDLGIIDKVENPDGTVLYDANAPVTPSETKTETTPKTFQQLKSEIERLRAEEEVKYSAIDPNDTVARKKIYDAYDILITPLLKEAKADIEARREKALNNAVLKKGIYTSKGTVKTYKQAFEENVVDFNLAEEFDKINAEYDAELESLKKKETPIIEPEALKNVTTTTKALEDLKAKTGKSVAVEIVTSPKYGIKDDDSSKSSEEILAIAYHKAKLGIKSWSSLNEENVDNEALVQVVEDLLTSKESSTIIEEKPKTTSTKEDIENKYPDYVKNFRESIYDVLNAFRRIGTTSASSKAFFFDSIVDNFIGKKVTGDNINQIIKGIGIPGSKGMKRTGITNTIEEYTKTANLKKEYDAELAALESKPAVTPQTTTTSDIEAKKADIERRRQESLNAIKQRPNETLFTAPYYKEGYNFKQLPTDSVMRTEAEEKEYYEILTNNNTLTDVSIQVKTKEEAEKLINAKYDAELTTLEKSKPETKEEEPKVKEPFPLSPQFEGKIIYFSPGIGKTTLVNQYPDQFVDMDVLLYEEFKDEPGFENATPETFGSTISAIYKSVKLNQPAFDAFDAIKNTHYNNAFKKAKALAKEGKTVLTGSVAFISRADFSVKATNEKITKDQLKNKTPGIDSTDLSEAMSSIRRNEKKNNILMSVDKDSFTQFLMGNYDILQYINQDVTFEQLDELGNFITSDMPEVVEAFNKKMEYLQAKILLFTNLQPGDTVIILNEKTGENVKTKIMKKRNADSYDLEITPGLEINSLNRNRLNTLINVIPVQGESEGIKVDDLDNADAENNKTKVNDIATETERLKALLDESFNDDNLFEDSEDPNNCKTN